MVNIQLQEFQQFTCEVFTRQDKYTLQPQFKLFNIDRCDTVLYKVSKQLNLQYYDLFCAIIQEDAVYYFYSYFKNGNVVQLFRPHSIYNVQKENCINIGGINIIKQFKEDVYETNINYDFIPNTQYLGEMLKADKQFVVEVAILDFSVKESLDEVGQILKVGYLQINFPYKFLQNGSQQKVAKQYNEEQIILKQISSESFQDPLQSQTLVEFVEVFTDMPSSEVNIEQIFNILPLSRLQLDFMQLYYVNQEHMFTAVKSCKQLIDFKIARKSKFKQQLILFGKQFRIIIYPNGNVSIRIFISQSIKTDYTTLIQNIQVQYLDILERLNVYIKKAIGKKVTLSDDKLKIFIKFISQSTFDFNIYYLFQNFLKNIKTLNSSLFQFDDTYSILNTRFFFGMEPCKVSIATDRNTIYFKYQTFFSSYSSLFPDLFCKYLQYLQKETEKTEDGREIALTKRLILNDPVLFSNLIQQNFSRVCQKGKQPEIALQTQANDPYVTKYWNFTTNTEQYYKCNQENPYLIFRLGHHVDGYCLPCCGNRNPEKSASTQLIQQKCQQKIAVLKDIKDAKYRLKNTNKFNIGRYTNLHKSFYQQLDQKLCVKCLIIPDSDLSSIQKIKSLINSIAYLLDIQPQDIVDLLLQFIKNNTTFQGFQHELNDFSTGNIFTKYDDENWIIFLTFYLNQVHYLDMIILNIINEESALYFTQIKTNKAIYLYKSNGIFNPVVSVEEIDETLIQDIPKFMQSEAPSINLNNYRLILEIQKEINNFEILQQIINKRNMCNYILCTVNQKYFLAPVIEQLPEQIPVLQSLNEEILNQLLDLHSLLKIIDYYHGKIQYIVKVKNQYVSVVKGDLFFDFQPISIDKLPTDLYDVNVLEYGLTPARMNGFVLKSQLKQAYWDLLNLCSKFNSCSESKHQQDEDMFIVVKMEQFVDKIQQYIQKQQINKIPKILLPCHQQPTQFFCQDNKLIITQELEYLQTLVRDQIQADSINLEQFKQGLFILVGRLQFIVNKDEFLTIKEVLK